MQRDHKVTQTRSVHQARSIGTLGALLLKVSSLAIVCVALGTTVQAQVALPQETEQELLDILRSDASQAEKAIACKSLAVKGSTNAIADLAKLLSDPKLASWARTALEAIPGDESEQALREAAESLDGRLRVGAINSLGVRRDIEAVDLLTRHLQGADAATAAAAAIALGRIGDESATKSLRKALATTSDNVQSAVAEGCVLCAERLHSAGNSVAAAAIYDEVRTADVPTQRIIEATRGAILAHKEQGQELLLETLRSPNKKFFQLALGTIREFPGDDLDNALVKELSNSEPARGALLVQAMSDRIETVDRAAILSAAQQGNELVRLSAIDALQRIGDASCLTPLMELANDDDEDLATAAKTTLAVLPGVEVDTLIVSMLSQAETQSETMLLDLVGRRRIKDAFKLASAALEHSDPNVRKSALFALGETVDLDGLSVLISEVTDSGQSETEAEAQRALKVASIRMPDSDKCTAKLVAAMDGTPSCKGVMLEIIGEVGGKAALEALAAAAKSEDAEKQDIASRLLGKWNNTDAAPVLLDLATTAPAEKFQIRALRGYIGIARKFSMPEQKRVEMCQKAWDTSKRMAEKELILEVLKVRPSRPALRLVAKAKQIPELAAKAMEAERAIQKKVGR
ncbi:MAG: HEAT repeat domain-containing protein [Planctomycetota bacterium]